MQTLPFELVAEQACFLEAHAVVEVPLSEIRGLRDAAGPEGAPALPPRFLRHCDEQTVVGVRAVLEAIASRPEAFPTLEQHGVIAAPRLAGRITAAQTLVGVASSGGIAVSPHVVPQCSLHALASAVSVGLGMHGPNLGSSGGPDALSEGLYTALTLVETSCRDGLWVVFTEWDEEPVLDAAGRPTNDPLCRGVALALAMRPADSHGVRLALGFAESPRDREPGQPRGSELADFAAALAMCVDGGVMAAWSHVCPWNAEIRVAAVAASGGAEPAAGRPVARREAA